MNIKSKLTLQFILIVAGILLFFSLAIYYFSLTDLKNKHRLNLKVRAINTAKLLLDISEIDGNLLKVIDKNTIMLYQEEIAVIDDSLRIIYNNNLDYLCSLEPFTRFLNKKTAFFTIKEKEGIKITHTYDSKNYYVLVAAYDKEGRDKLIVLRKILVWGYLISILIILAAGYFFSKRALKPISEIVNQVKKIKASNLNLRVDEGNRKDEIAMLAITFNEVLKQLENAFNSQRDFVSNASHELRTPFSVLIAEIDYAIRKDLTKEQYKELLSTVLKDIVKLNNLSSGLFELAQLGYKDNISFSSMRVDEILITSRYEVLEKYHDRQIHLKFINLPEDQEELLLQGNETLLIIAFKNVIDNACKFSDSDVNVILENDKTLFKIKIRDNGIGIPKREHVSIFYPFYRGQNARFIAGFGLGLPLISKIIEIHNGKISVESEENIGSTFTIILPKEKKFNLNTTLRD